MTLRRSTLTLIRLTLTLTLATLTLFVLWKLNHTKKAFSPPTWEKMLSLLAIKHHFVSLNPRFLFRPKTILINGRTNRDKNSPNIRYPILLSLVFL